MRKIVLTIMQLACLVIAGVALWQIVSQLYSEKQQDDAYQQLREQVLVLEDTTGEGAAHGNVADVEALCAQNADFAAWLYVDGVGISYPVMHTPDRPNYYLHRDFNGKTSSYGTPYLAEACELDQSDNLIIYGHNMKNGSMFAPLLRYEDSSVWQQGNRIRLDTTEGSREYQIFAVILTTVGDPEGDAFPYYSFVNATQAEYDSFVSLCKQLSMYNTGVTPAYGQQLLTLSTCEYSTTSDDSRFVVVACEIE